MKIVTATIITIGDELLFGQTINTNGSWIAFQLSYIGISVNKIITISDNKDVIKKEIQQSETDVVILTGGLGPTNDDKTKFALADLTNSPLVLRQDIIEDIKSIFGKNGKPLNKLNESQALFPIDAVKIKNEVGTAPGMWFFWENMNIISLPGVPREMKDMMEKSVLHKLKNTFQLPLLKHKFIKTVGIPESLLAEKIKDWEQNLSDDIRLAYLPSIGEVKLRLSALGTNEDLLNKKLDTETEKILKITHEYVYALDDISLIEFISNHLKEKNITISTAESCTGGAIASAFTSLPGSSLIFKGSIVAYSNEVKENQLDVSTQSLQKHGAVSEQVVVEMAQNVRNKLNTTIGVATSGIAGPDGGTDEKPVGTVWIALATNEKVITKKLELGYTGRASNIEKTVVAVLNLMRKTFV